MLVKPEDNPKITDTVLFTLTTTDSNGAAVNPYKVNQVIIYFIERGFTVENNKQLEEDVSGHLVDLFFKDAVSVTILGDEFYPAWLSSDTDVSFITKEDFDDAGNPQVGVFSLEWTPNLQVSGEGDYVVCWTWTPIAAGDSFSASLAFNLYGDTTATTSIPTHFTPSQKYEVLLDRYTPEMFKLGLGDADLTPDVLDRTNLSVAKGFTVLEDLTNQIVDLIDANVIKESLLPYLSNLFSWKLKSSNTALWRRQIKRAVPLYKKKGTLSGLEEALDEAGMKLVDFTQLWQVVSPYTWQESFVFSGSDIFTLSKLAVLDYPIDTLNFELFVRLEGTDEYIEVSLDYVSFSNFMGVTTMTWIGDNLSINPISLQDGDIVRIIYKVSSTVDQTIEDFIRTLDLADQRDEVDVTYPLKNWNVRVIAENDAMFDIVCPQRNPFHDPVVFGKVRTEFPYSENIYNMDEYNGCCVGSTTVITENGAKEIKDISNDGFILTEFGFRKFAELKNQGSRKTLKIITKMGRELMVTPNHKFRVINYDGKLEWKEAVNVKENDYILGKKGTSIPKNNGIDKEVWYLAGFAYGDGYLDKDKIKWLIPQLEKESLELIEDVLKKYNAKFHIFTRLPEKHQKNTPLNCNQEMYIVSTSRKQMPLLGEILPKHEKKGKWKKHLPTLIWQSGEEQISLFLRGLFDTDGSIQKGNSMLTTKWITLAKEVQRLLLILGIISSINVFRVIWKGKKRKYFRVNVFGKQSVKTFIEKVNFNVKSKKNALENNYSSTNVKGVVKTILSADRTVIPNAPEIIKAIFTYKKRISSLPAHKRSKEEKRILTLLTRLKQGYQRTIPDNVVSGILDKAKIYGNKDNEYFEFLKNYVEQGWFFDKVKKIKEGTTEDVYDPLNVDETTSYLSDGLVSHNSIRDSTNPCDLDKNFLDSCSCCLGSKFNITVEVQNLDPDRMSEALDVIRDFVPFHAVIHNINFIGSQIDYIIPPIEVIEKLITFQVTDNIIANNLNFNRLIEEGSSNAAELKRNMLATASVISSPTGTGKNSAIVLFSPGIQFDTVGIDTDGDNLLEILSGSNQGKYKVLIQESDRFVIDILQGVPDTISFPLNASSFPFRISNVLYTENSASIYQDDIFTFSDNSVEFPNLGTQIGWKIAVTSGIYVGTYTITSVNPDNSVVISGWPGVLNASFISYQLKTNTNVVVETSSGSIAVVRQGRLEIQLIAQEFGIHQDDYVLYGVSQYKITRIANRDLSLVDKVYIAEYTGGTVVGLANIAIYRRVIDNAVGYVDIRGLELTGTIPSIDGTLEDNTFLENYFILIGTSYYQITSIVGSTMTLSGPMLSWGLTGTSVPYSIIQFIKTSPITTQDGTEFYLLDRRGNDSIVVETETLSFAASNFMEAMPLSFTANVLNNINTGTNTWAESVRNQENITIDIVRR